jgi:hypothetical protein
MTISQKNIELKKNKGANFAFIFFSVLLFCTDPSLAQTETLGTTFNQAPPASDACGSTNVQIYGFSFNSTGFSNPNFTGLVNWTTSGTYIASDILNFKLWQTNFSVFNTTNLLATITTGLGPGTHSFPGFAYSVSPSPVTRYFWITVDLSATATNGNTIIANIITAAMTTITGTETFGTNTAGGTQTIICALPIELESFTGKRHGKKNILEWKTAAESKNDFFTLERSEDAITFSEIKTVKGAGNSSIERHYTATDDTPSFSDITYYRLKQTDYNGHFNYAGSLVAINNTIRGEVSIFPDPLTKKLKAYNLPGKAEYSILDLTGRVLSKGMLSDNDNEIDVSGYPFGMYVLLLETDSSQLTKKIIIER